MKIFLKTNLAWAAGFLDGEGCLSFSRAKNSPHYCGYVSISQTEKAPLQFLMDAFGGSMRQVKMNGNRKDYWHWVLASRKAERFLRLVSPYLRVKRERAEIFLEYQKLIRAKSGYLQGANTNTPLSENELSSRSALILRMKSLNKRGVA